MKRLLVICEGQTEETFVRELIGPFLQERGLYVSARLIGNPGHKGGIICYARARRDIVRTLKEDRSAFCTTMFDYFRLPMDECPHFSDWLARLEALGRNKGNVS